MRFPGVKFPIEGCTVQQTMVCVGFADNRIESPDDVLMMINQCVAKCCLLVGLICAG